MTNNQTTKGDYETSELSHSHCFNDPKRPDYEDHKNHLECCLCKSPQSKKTSWENIEPMLKTMRMYNGKEFCGLCGLDPKLLKKNILNLLKDQRQSIIEKLKGMKKKEDWDVMKKDCIEFRGYNQALDEAIKSISE